MEVASSGTTVEVVRVDDRYTDALVGFVRETWDNTATRAQVRQSRAADAAANPVSPGEDVPTFLFLADGRAVGHVTTTPIQLWQGGAEHPAHWVKGLVVLPQYRNGPVGFLLLKELVHHLDCAMAMVVQFAAYRLFEAVGFADLGVLPNFLRVLQPANLLRRLDLGTIGLSAMPRWAQLAVRAAQRPELRATVSAGATGATHLWTAVAGGRSSGYEVRMPDELNPSECDELWKRVRDRVPAAPSRNGRYLRWRYSTNGDKYRVIMVRDNRALAGLAVLRRPSDAGDPRLNGIRIATLSEVIFPSGHPDVGLAMLSAAEETAREFEADAVLCSTTNRRLAALLRRRAFIRIPGNAHFLTRRSALAPPLPQELGGWWLTRGDSNADEVF